MAMKAKGKAPATAQEYLGALPEDRRVALTAVRGVILDNLDAGYREGVKYGMIVYCVPHTVYPPGYHCDPKQPLPFASFASQKNHMALYLMSLYGNAGEEKWFRAAWAKTGKRLDMGRACIRFRRLEDLPLEVIGAAIARVPAKKYIEHYEAAIRGRGRKRQG